MVYIVLYLVGGLLFVNGLFLLGYAANLAGVAAFNFIGGILITVMAMYIAAKDLYNAFGETVSNTVAATCLTFSIAHVYMSFLNISRLAAGPWQKTSQGAPVCIFMAMLGNLFFSVFSHIGRQGAGWSAYGLGYHDRGFHYLFLSRTCEFPGGKSRSVVRFRFAPRFNARIRFDKDINGIETSFNHNANAPVLSIALKVFYF